MHMGAVGVGVGVAVLLVACHTPYQSMGFSGGYQERRIGERGWYIVAKGNAYTSRSTVIEYTYRRAAELCPFGFRALDADRDTSSSLHTFDGGSTYRESEKTEAVLVVECTGDAPPRVAPAARTPRAIRPAPVPQQTGPGWWCSEPADRVGLCWRHQRECEAFRAPNGPGGASGYGPCQPAAVATCAGSDCFASMSACAAFQANVGAPPGACSTRP